MNTETAVERVGKRCLTPFLLGAALFLMMAVAAQAALVSYAVIPAEAGIDGNLPTGQAGATDSAGTPARGWSAVSSGGNNGTVNGEVYLSERVQ